MSQYDVNCYFRLLGCYNGPKYQCNKCSMKHLAGLSPTLGAERARAPWKVQDSVLHVDRLREPAQEVPDPEPLQKGQP